MKTFIKKHALTFIGIVTGLAGGYLYYRFWGCTNGCPITGTPLNSTLYGGLLGGLLFNIFEKKDDNTH